MAYQLKIEKVIERSPSDVFQALKEGRLFMNCSADSNSIKVDFRVGGKYQLDFKNHKVSNWGEFLEIVPNQKVVFSWCQTFGADQKPDTKVTIELFSDGSKTRLVLAHEGFNTKETCDDHYQGWNGGLNDLGEEMRVGQIRMMRKFSVPVEKLYETCKNPESFFAFMGDLSRGNVSFKVGGKYQVPTQKGEVKGEFTEIIPNQKISLSWLAGCGGLEDSHVTLNFKSIDSGGSAVEIIHKGLIDAESIQSHRQGWDMVTLQMSYKFASKKN